MNRASHSLSIALGLAFGLGGRKSGAQVAYEAPTAHVEILGLRRWTLAMLQDSIRRYVPGQELHDAACMVTLRDSLHFVEASVARFEMAPPGRAKETFLTIKVIEPQEAARVQWNAPPRDEFTSLPADYAPLVLSMTDSTGTVRRAPLLYWLQFGDTESRQAALSRASSAARADGERVFAFLRAHTLEWHRIRALHALRADGFWVNRMMAATVLSNFSESDSTWWALVHALRDPHEAVRQAAAVALRTLPPRPIDWRPVVPDLHFLVGGTNLPAIEDVFDVLARTRIAPSLAPGLLRGNADWVLDHLGIREPMASDRAHRLLVQLNNGHDLGPARSDWAIWVTSF